MPMSGASRLNATPFADHWLMRFAGRSSWFVQDDQCLMRCRACKQLDVGTSVSWRDRANEIFLWQSFANAPRFLPLTRAVETIPPE